MMTTPKVTHEYETVSVNFSMISKAHEIEVMVRRPLTSLASNSGLGQRTNQHRAGPAPGVGAAILRGIVHVPTLRNPRHERFAQELAAGQAADAAYVMAGYKENRSNAARLGADRDIQARVAEIQSVGAERAAITVETLIAEAEAARSKAKAEKGGAAAAIAAITAKAN